MLPGHSKSSGKPVVAGYSNAGLRHAKKGTTLLVSIFADFAVLDKVCENL